MASLALILALFITGVLNQGPTGTVTGNSYEVPNANAYQKAALATEHPLCTDIGLEVLRKKRGTSVDAAIAVLICIGVVNSQSSGIGGGGFMLVRTPDGKYEMLDFRETAPAAARSNMYGADPGKKSQLGGMAVAVPGEMAGLFAAYRRYKRYRQDGPTWSQLLEPSIRLARDGFPISRRLHESIKLVLEDLRGNAELGGLFLDAQGNPLPAGAVVKRAKLAETLELIAGDPDAEKDTFDPEPDAEHDSIHTEPGQPRSFYHGAVAQSIVEAVAATSSDKSFLMAASDLANYTTVLRRVIESEYMGLRVVTAGPPTCGSMLLLMLHILEQYKIGSIANDSTSAHRVTEAIKFGFGARMRLGDPDKVQGMASIVKDMVNKERGEQLRRKIDDQRTFNETSHYADTWAKVKNHGTTHTSIVDEYGMAVSATSTINLIFGSMVTVEKYGILLNNHMDDFGIPGEDNFFNLPASEANFIGPGKRPMSSAAPVMIERNGQLVLVSGAAGGSLITTATMLSIINTFQLAMSPEGAVSAPRLHHQLDPNLLVYESNFNEQTLEGLRAKGHRLKEAQSNYRSSVQMVAMARDGLHAVSDIRKDGSSGGY